MLAAKFEVILPHLDERQRRLLLAAEARALGHGGIRAVARAAGVREATVSAGVDELDAGAPTLGRVRRPGGGRKRAVDLDPDLQPALLALVEPEERGDPMSPLRWTTKSTRRLAAELTRQGHRASADTVADLLREEGFSLQANTKTIEGRQHPDRDAQFRYINEQVTDHQNTADPVISVDTKKKELVGRFTNPGQQWRPTGEPAQTLTHDFPGDSEGKAVPYGIYDLTANTGWVNVGTDHDTAAFAVESIRRWWTDVGHNDYPDARRLLITADAGGSNGYRTRAWKAELATLATQTGLPITVCHFPPGTSKWNKIERRLFSHISMNWRGRPLTSHEVVVQSIAATTTTTGLRVRAHLDTDSYPTGLSITDADMLALPLARHPFHGDWNYTLHPGTSRHDQNRQQPTTTATDITALSNPLLTGMTPQELTDLTARLETLRHERQQAQQEHDQQQARNAGRKPHPPRTGRPRLFGFPNRVLATILHLRLELPRRSLAVLFNSNGATIHRAITEIRQLLDQEAIVITPATTPAAATALIRTAATSARTTAQIKTAS